MISTKIQRLAPSPTLSLNSKIKEMKKQGREIIDLAVGEPVFPVFTEIKEAGIEAINSNFTRYTPTAGITELKEIISKKFKTDNKISYLPEEIMASNGAKQVLFNALCALTNEGDEFIVPQPCWGSYAEQITLAGGVPVFAETDNFQITADLIFKKITPKTKGIILNSPCNPTGAVISEKELKKIAEAVLNNNLYVLSDEVYESFIYEQEHLSLAALNKEIKKRTITINAVSKTFSMTGLRLGYCGGPKEIIEGMTKIQDHTTSAPCSVTQKMALAALSQEPKKLDLIKTEFKKKRDYVASKLDEMGVSYVKPQGTFYVFPSIGKKGSVNFCQKLLEEKQVAVVPGLVFGSDQNIRISFAGSWEDLEKGMSRIKQFTEALN